MPITKFAYLTDLHYGFERKNGHKVPLHDTKALKATLDFLADFRPDVVILGGDMLDCGAISHHHQGKPGQIEGLRLLADAEGLKEALIKPLEALKPASLVYITGNHERWLSDLMEAEPGLKGILDIDRLLGLSAKRWKVIPQGGHYDLGKLIFVHGDQLKGGDNIAKASVIAYEKSIRFGHFHTYQVYSKTSALEYKNAKTGVAVPCLCGKLPSYGKGAPNKWQQGFCWGYVHADGTFSDYVSTIIGGRFSALGKTYQGG